MIFVYILLVILVLVLLILFTNIRIKITYQDGFDLSFYFGIFKIPKSLFNKKKKTKKPKKAEKKTADKKNSKDKKPTKSNKLIDKIKKKGFYLSYLEVIDFLKPVFTVLNSFSSKVKINPLIVKIKMTGDDAAKLAIDYGKFCAVYYPAVELVSEKTNCKNIDSNVFVDYTSNKPEIFVKTQIKIRVVHCLTHSFKILKEFLKFKSKFD